VSESTPRDPATINDPAKEEFDRGCQFLENNDLAQAANCFHNALLDYKERKDEHGIANASDKLADICLERKDFTAALPHLERAMTICEKANDDLSITALKKKIARTYDGLGEYRQAIIIYSELLETYQTFRDPGSAVRTLEAMAQTYLALGDKGKAADTLRTAAAIHRSFKHTRHAQDFENRAEKILNS
jgi:tetratricopeptide (TPR) repeat protein